MVVRFRRITASIEHPTLDTVGEDFMRQVFATDVGKPSSAPNNGKNVFYVFRVADKSPTMTELQDRFAKDPTKNTARRVAMSTVAKSTPVCMRRLKVD